MLGSPWIDSTGQKCCEPQCGKSRWLCASISCRGTADLEVSPKPRYRNLQMRVLSLCQITVEMSTLATLVVASAARIVSGPWQTPALATNVSSTPSLRVLQWSLLQPFFIRECCRTDLSIVMPRLYEEGQPLARQLFRAGIRCATRSPSYVALVPPVEQANVLYIHHLNEVRRLKDRQYYQEAGETFRSRGVEKAIWRRSRDALARQKQAARSYWKKREAKERHEREVRERQDPEGHYSSNCPVLIPTIMSFILHCMF